jgi:outer membrane scaffolding protein for murein synthesis (MipA/OmpV family)
MRNSNYLGLFALAVLQFSTPVVIAADIARDVRIAEKTPDFSDGGFFEIGAGLEWSDTPVRGEDDDVGIEIVLGGRYQWRGLFFESIYDASSILSLGYNAWNNDQWSLDIIGSTVNGGGHISDDNEELKGLTEKDLDFLVGGRATGYFGQSIVQFLLLSDVSDRHDGMIASVEGGRSWQVRNWNYHTLLGLRYNSKEVSNYYLGITPEEASATSLPAYKAGAGAILTAEIGATYPMSDHWVFRGTASVEHLTKNLNDSPIIKQENWPSLSATFSYVF